MSKKKIKTYFSETEKGCCIRLTHFICEKAGFDFPKIKAKAFLLLYNTLGAIYRD